MKKIVVLIMMVVLMSSCQKEVDKLDVSVVGITKYDTYSILHYEVTNKGWNDIAVILEFTLHGESKTISQTECINYYSVSTAKKRLTIDVDIKEVYFKKIILCK